MNAFGITNAGNTCWLNSLLQLIISCPHMHAYLLKYSHTKNSIVFNELSRLANCPTGSVVSLDAQFIRFMSNFDNSGGSAKCVDEALLYLFDKIDGKNELDLAPFGIRERVAIECSECAHVEQSVDYLPFKQIYTACNILNSLTEVQKFTNEKHHCSKCLKSTPSTVTRNLISARRYILILTNGAACDIPLQFSMGSLTYKLQCIIHYGGGHYFASALRGTSMFMFNDDKCAQINQFISSAIYMLCYQLNSV